MPGSSICWTAFTPDPQESNAINIGPPTLVNCSQYMAPLSVVGGTGAAILAGTLVMNYTRTWMEGVLHPPTHKRSS